MIMKQIVCVLFYMWETSALNDPVVTLSTGKVLGQTLVSAANRSYFSFRGVPYAAPPVGLLRFKAPQPPHEWNGTRNAFQIPPACAQPWRQVDVPETYSEDCLYLNVFTPHLQPPGGVLMPVMVFVHGGKRYQGSSTIYKYGADYLITQDVVVVTFNYRLGVFGFFTSHSQSAQGNASSKDKVAALRWVQREIWRFGGDPNLVTIFGGSSGAQDVSCLYISPMTQGLFHRAISQSGGGCGPAHRQDPYSAGVELAKLLGCPTDEPEALVACLRDVDSEVLAEKQMEVYSFEPGAVDDLRNPFVLNTLEGSHGEEVFLGSSTEEMLANLQSTVPFLLGVNSGDGNVFLKDTITEILTQFTAMERNFKSYLPYDLQEICNARMTTDNVVNTLKKRYFGNDSINLDAIDGFAHFMADSKLAYPTVQQAIVFAKYAPVYLYLLTFKGEFKRSRPIEYGLNITGVRHGEELGYLFYRNILVPQQNHMADYPRESATLNRMVRLWTNFARYGNPTPTWDPFLSEIWLPVNGSHTKHLVINDSLWMNSQDLLSDRMTVWDAVYHLEGRRHEADNTGIVAIIIVVAGLLAIVGFFKLAKTSSCRSNTVFK